MINIDFLRYKLKEKKITTKAIAQACNCSQQNINHKIKNNTLNIKEIFIILNLTNLKFEEIFKKTNISC